MASHKSKTTIFLPTELSLEDIQSKLSEYGPIRTAFKPNPQSAIVRFALATDAEKAVKGLKSSFKNIQFAFTRSFVRERAEKNPEKPLEEKPVTPSFQVKKPRLIIRNIPFSATIQSLKDVFSEHGTVKNCKIPEKNGKKGGFAFVEMLKLEQAQAALEALNGTVLDNRAIAVDWSLPKDKFEKMAQEMSKSEPKLELDIPEEELEVKEVAEPSTVREKVIGSTLPAVEEGTTLFVRNISYDSNDDDFTNFFSSFGQLRYALLTKDKNTGYLKGTGFVAFFHKKDADECIAQYEKAVKEIAPEQDSNGQQKSILVAEPSLTASSQPFILDGRFLHVSRAVTRDEAQVFSEKYKIKNDKRNMYLLKEGVIFPESDAAKDMESKDLEKRTASYNSRKTLLAKNPNLFISKTRLSIRNLSPKVDEKELRKVAISILKKCELPSKPVIKQIKILRDRSKIDATTGKPRATGAAFLEFSEHEPALQLLRELNNAPMTDIPGQKKRLIIEFAIENNLILKQREERMKRMEQNSDSKLEKNEKKKNSDSKLEKKDKKKNSDSKLEKKDKKKHSDSKLEKNEKIKNENPEKNKDKKKIENSKNGKNEKTFPKKENREKKRAATQENHEKVKKARILESKKEEKMEKPLKRKTLNQEDAKFDNLVQQYKKNIFSDNSENVQKKMKKWYEE